MLIQWRGRWYWWQSDHWERGYNKGGKVYISGLDYSRKKIY